MSFNQPTANPGLQLGGGGDAPKQVVPAFGLTAKPTFGGAPGMGSSTGGFGASGFNFGGAANTPAQAAFSLPTAASAPSTGFGFGTQAAAPASTPSFGNVASTQPLNFSLGIGSTQAPSAASGFSLGGAPATAATSGFSIGGALTSSAPSGFSLGGVSSAAAPTGFALGGAPTATPSSGFSLGGTSTATAPTGLSLGGVSTATAPGGFSLAGVSTTAASGFSLGGVSTATAPSGFSLGGVSTATAPSGFSLGGVSTASAPSGFSLGGVSTASAPSGFSLAASNAPTATAAPSVTVTSATPAASGFGFAAAATVPASSAAVTTSAPAGFTLGGTTSTPASSGFTLGATGAPSIAPTTTSAPTFSFPTASSASTLSFGTTATTSAPLTFSSNLGSAATSTATTSGTTTSASSGPVTSLNFVQLEETINKWTMDLEEQEKLFMLQATQVNAWDRTLTSNGEKIEGLNRAVESIKLEQQRLDNELDFICSQQRELEDCLVPLEKELAGNAVTDPEREHTYELAANMDTQLKQMSEDLKEIIENLNERNRAQDSSDPLVQIGRILNSHMDSLQWIEHNTHAIQNHLDQVTKLHDSHRRDNERSFHLTYD